MADDLEESSSVVDQDRAASTKAAFDSGRYYKDENGNWSIKPPNYSGSGQSSSADVRKAAEKKSRSDKWYDKKDQ